jgi:hypothetical protein
MLLVSFLAAAAKLIDDLTVALVNRGEVVGLDEEGNGVGCGGSAGGGICLVDGRSDAVREFVRDMECDNRSLSFSSLSATAASFAETSTGLDKMDYKHKDKDDDSKTHLAAPNGLDREVPVVGFGDDRGEATTELLEDLGRSSSLRRTGVGGADSLAGIST